MIPKTLHFCYGLKQGCQFGVLDFIAIESAIRHIQPEKVLLHHRFGFQGKWWERIKDKVTLNHVYPSGTIGGKPVNHYAHQADIVRLEQLIEHGGIYLDMDTVTLNNFDSLLGLSCVMGKVKHPSGPGGFGLSNAVMLAEKGSAFLGQWLVRYRDFEPSPFDYFSTVVPAMLARTEAFRDTVRVFDRMAFCHPHWSDIGFLFNPNYQPYPILAYTTHLWASKTREKYLDRIDEDYIQNVDNNFTRLAREYIS